MCGIFVFYDKKGFRTDQKIIDAIDNDCKLMDHRGESSKKYIINNKVYCHHRRLPIVDLSHKASQPFLNSGIFVLVNGEIYNHQDLRKQVKADWTAGKPPYIYKSSSDCEVLIPMYMTYGTAFVSKLNGMYSFALFDLSKNLLLVSRDFLGMTSLYFAKGDDTLAFSSEMKCLTRIAKEQNMTIENFKPGNLFICISDKTKPLESNFSVYKPSWKEEGFAFQPADISLIRGTLERSIQKHLTSDAPLGCLLSGGLDSSIVAAVASKYISGTLSTFTIGVENSADVLAAAKVAAHLGTNHTAYSFEVDDAIGVLEDVIYAIETYDITTVRASIPLYLLTMFIKEDTQCKVLLSGEVSDELFAGYSYFKHAPTSNELFLETKDKVEALHKYDCLRAHKAALANTIEVRIPFGDQSVVDMAMGIDPEDKMYSKYGIEKHILREAFKDSLPEEIVSRPKEQFSDGVSSDGVNLIDALKAHADAMVTDKQLEDAAVTFPVNTPITKEGVLYRRLFDNHFPLSSQTTTVDNNTLSVACSTARALRWMNISPTSTSNDPSGRSA
jgi:asparagine synthase (glutamine-hydrolysing)